MQPIHPVQYSSGRKINASSGPGAWPASPETNSSRSAREWAPSYTCWSSAENCEATLPSQSIDARSFETVYRHHQIVCGVSRNHKLHRYPPYHILVPHDNPAQVFRKLLLGFRIDCSAHLFFMVRRVRVGDLGNRIFDARSVLAVSIRNFFRFVRGKYSNIEKILSESANGI